MKNESRVDRAQLMRIAVVCVPFFLIGFVVVKFQLGVHKHDVFGELAAKCRKDIDDGNADEALALAQEGWRRFRNDSDHFYRGEFSFLLPNAYELAGDYDNALKYYSQVTSDSIYISLSAVRARVNYKRGALEEAFRDYCFYLREFQEFRRVKRDDPFDAVNQGLLRETIRGSVGYSVDRLSAFADYSEFLAFMEDEFERLGRPAEYEEAMNRFRSCAVDADEADAT